MLFRLRFNEQRDFFGLCLCVENSYYYRVLMVTLLLFNVDWSRLVDCVVWGLWCLGTFLGLFTG